MTRPAGYRIHRPPAGRVSCSPEAFERILQAAKTKAKTCDAPSSSGPRSMSCG